MIGFLVAPISLGVVFAIFQEQVGMSIWILQFAAILGYPIAALVGVPAHLLLKRYGRTSIGSYLCVSLAPAAALIGLFVVLPIVWAHSPLAMAHLAQITYAVAFSAISVAVFWFIARPDLPDEIAGRSDQA